MFEVKLDGIGKRFVKEWIFRDCTYAFNSGKAYAITGPNGSGKSTLAQIISGFATPTRGNVRYNVDGNQMEIERVYQYLNFAAPYADLIEEFTLQEMLNFHFKMKPPVEGLSLSDIPKLVRLEGALAKEVRNFSSGMKQRLKLGLAFSTQSELIILDEPTTNLDEDGVSWYLEQVERFCRDKLLIISSNQHREYGFCDEILDLQQWKKAISG